MAEESAIALTYNGEAHAVLMATPADLTDLALGFTISEGVESRPGKIIVEDAIEEDLGWTINTLLEDEAFDRLITRRRAFAAGAGCGVCGVESLEAALRPLPHLPKTQLRSLQTIHAGMQNLRAHQPLSDATGAVHGAAFMDASGIITHVREDVGRHNALDKLIGALAAKGIDTASGTVLLTSRCSMELVQKAIAAGLPALACISAPTTLAIDLATQHGLALATLVRDDELTIAADPHGLFV